MEGNMRGAPLNTQEEIEAGQDALLARNADYVLGWNAAIEKCRQAQPPTAERPDENTYQRGFFDGVIAYGRAILALRR
jgi:hypothetical protein